MSMVKIMELVRQKRLTILEEINQYNLHSAWFDVDYMVAFASQFLVPPHLLSPCMP
jgi:hypothetical protein